MTEPYDSSDPKQVKKARQKAYAIDERMNNGIAKICNDPDCRFVLAAFFEEANMFHSNFNANPTQHAFNEGFRSSGLWWLTKALLNDKNILSKMEHDKGLEGTNHDRHTDTSSFDTSSDTDN